VRTANSPLLGAFTQRKRMQTATDLNDAEGRAFNSNSPRARPAQILDYASGFLLAFGVSVALSRQLEQGGSWHVQVSLAQTANWLRRFGQIEGNLETGEIDLASYSEACESGYGALRAIPHAARIAERKIDWKKVSNPPGTDLPNW
jgi:hypothetical protein